MADAASTNSGTEGAATGAAAGAGTGTSGAAAGSGAANAPWYGEVAPEVKTWADGKAYKDAAAALSAHMSLEKLIGVPADQILRLPKADDAAGWDGVWNKLGRPESADKYELPVPDGDDGSFAKQVAPLLYANGVPKAMAQKLAAGMNEMAAAMLKTQREEAQAKSTTELAGLKTEWGNDFAKRTEFGRRALREMGASAGLNDQDLGALEASIGTAKMLKLFAGLGEATATAKFSGPDTAGAFQMTRSQAQAKIVQLRQDQDWVKSYASGDRNKIDEFTRLNEIANAS